MDLSLFTSIIYYPLELNIFQTTLSFCILKSCLFIWKTDTEGERGKTFHVLAQSPNFQRPELCQAKARTLEFHRDLSGCGRDPRTQLLSALSRLLSQRLNWKWCRKESNRVRRQCHNGGSIHRTTLLVLQSLPLIQKHLLMNWGREPGSQALSTHKKVTENF